MTAIDVARVLEKAATKRGAPAYVRSDNGPEFISIALQEWTAERDSQMRYVKPGSPWQNGCVESFHDKLRDEFLQQETLRQWRRLECSSKTGTCSTIKSGRTAHWDI